MESSAGYHKPPTSMKIHGIYGRVIQDNKGFFTNDPASHPDSIGLAEGHPPLTAFLGVPLVHHGKTIGVVGLGNRKGGYRSEDLEALESLSVAIVQAIMRKRAEDALRDLNAQLEYRVQQRTAEVRVASLYARSLIEASRITGNGSSQTAERLTSTTSRSPMWTVRP